MSFVQHSPDRPLPSSMHVLTMTRSFILALLFVTLGAIHLEAQPSDSGTVEVTVREAMGMTEGFVVRSENRSAPTDASGRARLVLPSGEHTVAVTRIGFTPKRVTVMVI